jgi:hypothetical protein
MEGRGVSKIDFQVKGLPFAPEILGKLLYGRLEQWRNWPGGARLSVYAVNRADTMLATFYAQATNGGQEMSKNRHVGKVSPKIHKIITACH